MTTLQLQAYELISQLNDTKLQLIIDVMKNFTSSEDTPNKQKREKRKLSGEISIGMAGYLALNLSSISSTFPGSSSPKTRFTVRNSTRKIRPSTAA